MESELPTFGPKSQEAKIEDFERSTLDLVMQQLGHSKAEVRTLRSGLGDEGWNFEWFNGEGLIKPRVVATRVFRFDLAEAFFRPGASALVREYFRRYDAIEPGQDFIMIFRVAEWGRMVATSLPCPDRPHIYTTVRSRSLAIASMTDFFTQWRPDHG